MYKHRHCTCPVNGNRFTKFAITRCHVFQIVSHNSTFLCGKNLLKLFHEYPMKGNFQLISCTFKVLQGRPSITCDLSKLLDICIIGPFTIASFPQSFLPNVFRARERVKCSYLSYRVCRKTYMAKDTFAVLVSVTIENLVAVFPTTLLNSSVILAVATKQRLKTTSNTLRSAWRV